MAAKNPTFDYPVDVTRIEWNNITESDTANPVAVSGLGPAVGSVQFIGTFGSATAVLQGSNDGSTWVNLEDQNGDAISLTAAGAVDFSTAMLHLRPSMSGGSSQDIDVFMVLRK